MLDMDFKNATFDIIWSEGALYFFGFHKGLKGLNYVLKDNGYLAFSEAVYLIPDPPEQVIKYWADEYPDIGTIQENITLIQEEGFRLIDHFTLPKEAWSDHFYTPMEKRIERLKEKYANNQTALYYTKNMIFTHQLFS